MYVQNLLEVIIIPMTVRSLVLHCAMLRCTEETMASKNATIVLEAIALREQPCQILQRTPANALCVAVLVNVSFPIGHHTHINMMYCFTHYVYAR